MNFLKMLHVFGAMLFVGNVIVTASWKVMADRSRDKKIIAFGQRLVNFTDFLFSAAGVFILLTTGLFMAQPYTKDQGLWTVPWLAWGLGLLLASVFLWMLVLLPVQTLQASIVRHFSETEEIPKKYWILGRIWIFFGLIAVALPLMNLYFMIFRPT
jgi:uncharacterized membrane protein